MGYKFRSDPVESHICTEGGFYFLLNFQSGKSTLLLGILLLAIIQQCCWDRCTTTQDSRTPQTTSWASLTTIFNLLILPCFSVNLETMFTLSMFSFQVLRRWWCSRIYHKDRLVRQLYTPLRVYGACALRISHESRTVSQRVSWKESNLSPDAWVIA